MPKGLVFVGCVLRIKTVTFVQNDVWSSSVLLVRMAHPTRFPHSLTFQVTLKVENLEEIIL